MSVYKERVSETSTVISQLDSAFDGNVKKFSEKEFADEMNRRSVFDRLISRADALAMTDKLDIAGAFQAYELYGKCLGLLHGQNETAREVLVNARKGQVLRAVVVPNRDESRTAAFACLMDASKAYLRFGLPEAAGIELTNAALTILEMNNPSRSQLESAYEALIRSVDLKRKKEDWTYSQVNLAICEMKLAPFAKDPLDRLRSSWRRVVEADEIRVRLGLDEFDSSAIPRTMSEIARALRDFRNLMALREQAANREAEIPDALLEMYAADPAKVAKSFASNPTAYGFEKTPDWALQSNCAEVESAEVVFAIEKISERLKLKTADRDGLLWERALLDWDGRGDREFTDVVAEALEATWEVRDLELYFIRAKMFLGSSIASTKAYGLNSDYQSMIERMSICLVEFRSNWSDIDISRLLLRNDSTFRFLACELAMYGLYEKAFSVLEASRGLFSSRELQIDTRRNYVPTDQAREYCWVHVTHSPAGVVIVGMRERCESGHIEHFGRSFRDLPGADLATLFSGFVGGYGLISAQHAGDRRAARFAADKISEKLLPVADGLVELAQAERVLICPGGYFQAFPITSLVSSGGQVVGESMKLSTTPSRNVGLNPVAAPQLTSVVAVSIAADVPGLKPLEYSSMELRAMASRVQVFELPATSVDILSGGDGSGVVLHFSGHSHSDANPENSSMLLYGASLSVSDILRERPRYTGVVLSSCSSSLSENFSLQDEFLTLQSSFIYSGSRFSVGASWPVTDFAAFCFSTRLYGNELIIPSCAPEDWLIAFWQTVNWMRTVKKERLEAYIAALPVETSLPSYLRGLEPGDLVFGSFYDWGAFSIMLKLPGKVVLD